MAKTSLIMSGKFKRLVAGLGIPAPYVRGLLDTIWDSAHVKGSPVLGCAEDIEAVAEWPGEPGKLVSEMVGVGFLDRVAGGVHVIHDYWDHATEYAIDRYRARVSRMLGIEQMTRSQARIHAARAYRMILAGMDQHEAEEAAEVPHANGQQASTKAEPAKRKRTPAAPKVSPFVENPPSVDEVEEYIAAKREYTDPRDLAELFIANKTMSQWTWGPQRIPITNWKNAVNQFLKANWKAEKLRIKPGNAMKEPEPQRRTLSMDRADNPDVPEYIFSQYARDVVEGRAKVGTFKEWMERRSK